MPLPTTPHVPTIDLASQRLVIYGPPKVGKSTFATQNKDALVIDCDNNGTAFLNCLRVPVFSWDELKKTLGEVAKERQDGNHRFKTIILDTVDGAYQFCRQAVCAANGVAHESEDKAFGRLWDMVKTEWMKMVTYTQSLDVGLWMVSHSTQKEVKISGVKRTVTTTSLSGTAQRMIMALADEIIYIESEEDGSRTLYLIPQDGLECGGRLARFGLDKNINFRQESEAYAKLIEAIKPNKEN